MPRLPRGGGCKRPRGPRCGAIEEGPMKRSAILVAAGLALTPLAASAHVTVTRDHIRGRAVFADWQYTTTAGEPTFVSLNAGELASQPGSSIDGPFLAIAVLRSDGQS